MSIKNFRRRSFLWIQKLLKGEKEYFSPYGMPVYIPTDGDLTLRYGLARGRPYEHAEGQLIQKYLKPGTNVIEFGGCLGIISALIRSLIGPQAQHLIVEARPDLAAICLKNASQGADPGKTEVVAAAIDYSGRSTVRFSKGSYAHAGRVAITDDADFPVPTETLGSLVKRMPATSFALICDIEGAEYDLIAFEKLTLERVSLLIIEIHPHPSDPARTELDLVEEIRRVGLRWVERVGDVHCFLREGHL